MALSPAPRWTLDELCARVPLALAGDYTGQASGRIRDVPDQRTIRYYATLGLLDRPAEMRGRTALYGPRHLRQLVAIKRLQTHGLSLAEIQARLLGLSEESLAGLAQVPPEIERDPAASGTKPVAESTARAGASFWKASPAQPSHPASDALEMRVALAPGLTWCWTPLGHWMLTIYRRWPRRPRRS